jgi:hypothetical protein
MHLSRRAIVLLLPMVMFGAGARAWSANSDQAITTKGQIASATNGSADLLSILRPVANDARSQTHEPKHRCQSPQLYSLHDVVGDPESCVMGRYTSGIGQTFAPVTAP